MSGMLYYGDSIAMTGRGGTANVAAHASGQVTLSVGGNAVSVIGHLTPAAARQLAHELQVAAEVVDREAERLAEARIERGHLLAEVAR